MARVALSILLLFLTGCPKEKRKDCRPLLVEVGAGSWSGTSEVCRAYGGAWPKDVAKRFRIAALPWFVTAEITDDIIIFADAHAPRGVVKTEYTYQTNVLVTNDVEITVFLATSQHQLGVIVEGDGMVSNAELQCRAGSDRCAASYKETETVVLDLQPDAGWEIGSISGCGTLAASGTQLSGTLTADVEQCVVAFRRDANTAVLDLFVTGGGGEVKVESPTLNDTCTGDCSMPFPIGSQVTLTAMEAGDFVFIGWSGECQPAGLSASITMNADATCTAEFYNSNATYHLLTVSVEGPGYVSLPGMGSCNSSPCEYPILEGSTITLTAHPDREQNAVVSHWTGDCATGSVDSVDVVMSSNKTCGVVFERAGFDCTNPVPPTAGRIVFYDSTNTEITQTRTQDFGPPIGVRDVYVLPSSGIVRAVPEDFISNVGGALLYAWDDQWQGAGTPEPTLSGPEITVNASTIFANTVYGIWVEATDGCMGTASTDVFYMKE